jgi:hypothetical protein
MTREGGYPALYHSTQRAAAFVECLAVFRTDPVVLAGYDQIVPDRRDAVEPHPAGEGSIQWLRQRCLGQGRH